MKKKFTKKQIIVIAVVVVFGCTLMGILFGVPKAEKITISDISMNKGETKELEVIVEPEKAKKEKLSCKVDDKDIATISNMKIKGKGEGETTIKCSLDGVDGKATLTVSLTEEQQKEKEAEEAKKLEENRNTLSTEDQIRVRDYVKESVNKILKAPKTADYPDSTFNQLKDWTMVKANNLVSISTYVDSENSFGAMIRSTIVAQVQMADDGSGNLTYLELDGEVYFGTKQ